MGDFARLVTKANTSIEELILGACISGTKSVGAFRFAESLGLEGSARFAAQGSLEAIVGENGVKNLENLSQSSEDASNALKRFGAATSAAFAPLLSGVNNLITNLFGGISPLEKLERKQAQASDIGSRTRFGPRSGATATQNTLNRQIEKLEQNPETKAQLQLQKDINTVVDGRVKLAKDAANIERTSLTARRDTLAAARGAFEISQQQLKLRLINLIAG